MSKASEYARACKLREELRPSPFGDDARVKDDGGLDLDGVDLSPKEAVKFLEWMNDTFGEPSP